MTRSLAALALAALAIVPVPAQADPQVTPGCDNPVDVVCNQTYSPEHPSTPVICFLWMNGQCRIR